MIKSVNIKENFNYLDNVYEIALILDIIENRGYIAGGALREYFKYIEPVRKLSYLNDIFSGEKDIDYDVPAEETFYEDELYDLTEEFHNKRDYDIYFKTKEDYEYAYNKLSKSSHSLIGGKEFIKIYENEIQSTFHEFNYTEKTKEELIKIQLIKSFIGEPVDIINNFDFSVCRIVLDNNILYYDEDFFEDLTKNRLRIKNIVCPVSEIRRVIKYAKKGFYISNFQLLKIFKEFESNDEDWKDKVFNLSEKSELDGKLEEIEFEEMEQLLIKLD